jgi:hypothetical protein
MDLNVLVADLKAAHDRIDQAISALEGPTSSASTRRGRPPQSNSARIGQRRHMSAAARKRISEAMKKRWANWHGKSAPRRKPMSPAARKRLSKMMKQRWAAQKKSKAA